MFRPWQLAFVPLFFGAAFLAKARPEQPRHTHRNLGKAYYEKGEYGLAAREFLKVLEPGKAQARDYFNAGMALLQSGDYDRALGAFTTARQMEPGLAAADFGLGLLYKRQLRYPLALAAFKRVVASHPEDPCTWFNIGAVSFSMEQWPEARQAFQRVLAMGYPVARNFYVSALFRQATLLSRQNLHQQARKYFAEFQSLRETVPGISLTTQALESGRHGQIEIPVPIAEGPSGPILLPEFILLSELRFADSPCSAGSAGAKPQVALGDFDGDRLLDLFVSNPCGQNQIFRNRGEGRFREVSAAVGLRGSDGGLGAVFLDHDNSGFRSLLVLAEEGIRFYLNRKGSFTDVSARSGLGQERAEAGSSVLSFDFDSDGQLDVVLTGVRSRGPGVSAIRLYRNKGDGSFRDVSGESGISAAGQAHWRRAAFADFDEDGFSDLFLVGPSSHALLLRNLGDGRFQGSPISLGAGLGGRAANQIEVGDFDADGWFDAFISGEGGCALLRNGGQGRLQVVSNFPSLASHREAPALLLDLNADGFGDFLLRDSAGGARLLAHRGGNRFEETSLELPGPATGFAAWADLDGKGNTDLITAGADGLVRVFRRRFPAGRHWLTLSLIGEKSNRQAVGAVVEVKAGDFYQKHLSRGLPLLIYTGERTKVDVVRVTWTNGVIQNEVEVGSDRHLDLVESDRQTSSCPFLYLWDGEGFRFLTDIVGRAPLGETFPDGSPVHPNPEDYVRIPPGKMQPLDGRYVFQVTEELREIAYLDAVELLAVDHREGGEIYTDERVSAPPFAPFRLYRVAEKRLPASATNGRGEDVLSLLSHADGRYLGPLSRDWIPGVAREHAIVLDAGDLSRAASVRLFLTGWVYWVNASGMRALSTHGQTALRPPLIQVRDRSGRWVTVVENLGLPSGIDRTVVADLTGKFLSSDYSVRVLTNLRVHWDHAFFSTEGDSLSPGVLRLRPTVADLHYRGFSLPVHERGSPRPDFFDYGRLLEEPPWNAASGSYTRFGDVTSLLHSADNRLVVMAPGDELTLAFNAGELPPLPAGWRRDFVLHFTGWAKDNDPNTRFSGTVEPLPFLEMSGYRYLSGEAVTPELLDYRSQYQTRRVPLLVPPLAPLSSPQR